MTASEAPAGARTRPIKILIAVMGLDQHEAGAYAVGMAFLPANAPDQSAEHCEKIAAEEGLTVLGWREVPVDPSMIGLQALDAMPVFRMLFLAGQGGESGIDLDRLCLIARKRMEHEVGGGSDADGSQEDGVYFPSLSARTLIYKGMLVSGQVEEFFANDLRDDRLETIAPDCCGHKKGRNPVRWEFRPVSLLRYNVIGGGGRNRTAVRRHSIPGTTCLALRWISSRDSTARKAHPRTSLLKVDRELAGGGSRRFRDSDPTLRARTQAVSGLRP